MKNNKRKRENDMEGEDDEVKVIPTTQELEEAKLNEDTVQIKNYFSDLSSACDMEKESVAVQYHLSVVIVAFLKATYMWLDLDICATLNMQFDDNKISVEDLFEKFGKANVQEGFRSFSKVLLGHTTETTCAGLTMLKQSIYNVITINQPSSSPYKNDKLRGKLPYFTVFSISILYFSILYSLYSIRQIIAR
jgi:hypothetical protein